MIVRPATPADLGAVYAVWYATEVAGMATPPPPRSMPWFGHLLRIGTLVVAEDDVNVVGFAGAFDHGRCVALSDLFVHPDRQSQGIGRALLDAVVPADRPVVTMASADPRAVASYARRGMRPRWPAYYLAVEADELRDAPWPELEVAPCSPRGYAWELPGDDVHYAALGAIPLAIGRRGSRLGTALTVAGSPQRLAHPDTTEVLESSVDDPRDGGAVVLSVVRHLLDAGARRVALQVPGPHGALAPLLERGFTITDADMACATHEDLLADPSRHTMHGEARVALA